MSGTCPDCEAGRDALARAEQERDDARAHLQAVREFAWGLGASTATRGQILEATERQPFVRP